MPFQDIEKRRAYQRERKRQQKSNPSLSPGMRIYFSWADPNYYLPRCTRPMLVMFQRGFFVTANPEFQRLIEGDDEFGKTVFRLLTTTDSS